MRNAIATTSHAARSTSLSKSSRELLSKILGVCEDGKAEEIEALDVRAISNVSDYFLVLSGRSDRHVQGIARRLLEFAEMEGLQILSLEGFDQGHWILVDFGDIVAHVFYSPLRGEYNLESLWSQAPRLQLKKKKRAVLQAA